MRPRLTARTPFFRKKKMCALVFVNNEEPIELVKDLEIRFPTLKLVPSFGYKTINKDSCLCQLDLERMFKDAEISYLFDGVNYSIEEK